MIKLQDTIIQASTEDVINTLRFDLAQKGLNRFAIVRLNGENLQSNCPFHKNGQERKPSFGVNGEIDRCHCFSCSWSGTIEEMISELYGYQDDGKFGKRWLIKRFNTVEIETRPNIMGGFNVRKNITFNDGKNFGNAETDRQIDGTSSGITEEELDNWKKNHSEKYELSHAKGLGELSSEVLKEVCFEKQRYKKITVSDAEATKRLLDILEGPVVASRKQFIYDNATQLGFNFI